MSAIVAAHGPFDPVEGHRMLDRLTHRGPDGEGFRAVGSSWLGHRRLAIMDLEAGGQPMADEEGATWLVGDGEIYNARRLRTGLEQRGCVFRTRSDHESVLHLVKNEGPDALERLWGMFAFIVAGEDGLFVAARDALGITPLYWIRDGDNVIFGSELKAFDPERRRDVEVFPPGHSWTPDAGLHEFRPIFAEPEPPTILREKSGEPEPAPEVLELIRDTVVSAVEHSMEADVRVGTFLSGGLDSSIVTAIAARAAQRQGWRLPTFSVGLADSEDLAAARRVSEAYGTDHHERVYTADDLLDWTPEVIGVIESFDPQLVHSSVPNLLVGKLAARHVKVVLIGEGADELFAGYTHYGELESAADLHRELLITLEGLHNLGLQRVDRVAGACAIESRIPFLDSDVLELGMSLPPKWKLTTEARAEKWLLRKAFEGWLPEDLLWRKKAQFGEGTGANEILARYWTQTVSEDELAELREDVDPPLRTREEAAYYRMFQRHLGGLPTEDLVGRFVEA